MKKVLIILGLVMLLAVSSAIFLTRHDNKKQSSSTNTIATKSNSNKTNPAKAPVAPTRGTLRKQACDLLTDKLANTTIGSGAVKNEKLTAFQTLDYRLSSCEYVGGNKKVTVSLYEYATTDKANADKENVATHQMVVENGGKTTSLQPKTSVAEAKNKFVVTVTVMKADKFDSASSQQLLKSIVGKLK